MTKPFGFEKPLGMRDTLPVLYRNKQQFRGAILQHIKRHGYELLETPALEYYETVGSATTIAEEQLFKFLDQQGRTVVLRPDMTAPIARITASNLRNHPQPLRLAYDANVYRAQRHEGGHPAEFEQAGVELIGDATVTADAEVIALLVDILKQVHLDTFHIAIGHIGFVNALFYECVGDEAVAEKLRYYLFAKNIVAFKQMIRELSIAAEQKDGLYALLDMHGHRDVLTKAAQWTQSEQSQRILRTLEKLMDILDDYGVSDAVSFDFTLVSHMDYYTGIVFEGYHDHLGFPVASGGRYDDLLGTFDYDLPAVGFGVFLDRLVEAAPTAEAEQTSCGIIFVENQRRQAIQLARSKRQQGVHTVLQSLEGLNDQAAFSQAFTEVIDMTEQEDR